jgi:CrcB protein
MNPSFATMGLVAVCGALGSVARLLVSTGVRQAVGEPYLVGTFVVNVLGCLLFGVCWGYASGNWSKAMQAAVFTGFFGGFTTFSSFAFESWELLQEGRFGLALGNILLQNVLGVLASWFGVVIGRDLA